MDSVAPARLRIRLHLCGELHNVHSGREEAYFQVFADKNDVNLIGRTWGDRVEYRLAGTGYDQQETQ